MWIVISKEGKVYASQFSPSNFIVLDGEYEISANSSQNYAFSHWTDGSTVATRKITVSENVTNINAYYDNLHSLLSIEGSEIDGTPINGVKVMVIRDGSIINEGLTPYNIHVSPVVLSPDSL